VRPRRHRLRVAGPLVLVLARLRAELAALAVAVALAEQGAAADGPGHKQQAADH
jgi:hypothetical protein